MLFKSIFWRKKKLYKLYKLGGGNLDKIQKNSYFFFVKPSLSSYSWAKFAASLRDLNQESQFAAA